MTDRVYPSLKPNGKTKTTTASTTQNRNPPPPPPPPRKPRSHPHRPNPTTKQQTRRRSRRGYFCLFCFWSILVTILLLLLATAAAAILYLLYSPHRPTFSIAALKISEFNLTTSDDITKLTSKLNLTISTKNPNNRIIFYYDSFAITCLSDQTKIANGTFKNSFVSNPDNITIIRSSLYSNSMLLEIETVNKIKSDLKKKTGLPLKILLDTEARVKIESLMSKKVGIRIKCEGMHSLIPKRNSRNSSSSVAAAVSDAKCKLDLRVKIWKWTY